MFPALDIGDDKYVEGNGGVDERSNFRRKDRDKQRNDIKVTEKMNIMYEKESEDC